MTKLAFVDTETTGLDPYLHEIWEVGLIVREEDGTETEHEWQLPVDLSRADAVALDVGRYHERAMRGYSMPVYRPGRGDWAVSGGFARSFADLTWGAHLVGAVVSFDEERLRRLLRKNGQCPGWHYHLVTVEALLAGWISGVMHGAEAPTAYSEALYRPPWNSEELSRAVGVEPDEYERHTALGDAQWAKALYEMAMTP